MTFPDLRPAFPHAATFTVHGQETLHDVDFQPGCGYVSVEEARILWQLARAFPGAWCEIGSHTGWSGAHIAAAGVTLWAIEPQFRDPAFLARAIENWERANVYKVIWPLATHSWEWLPVTGLTFNGAFIDGDHDEGRPLQDAQLLLPRMAERCVIALHDNVGAPVAEAVEWLAGQGFQVRVLDTMAKLTVCWRGVMDEGALA